MIPDNSSKLVSKWKFESFLQLFDFEFMTYNDH